MWLPGEVSLIPKYVIWEEYAQEKKETAETCFCFKGERCSGSMNDLESFTLYSEIAPNSFKIFWRAGME